MHLFHLTKCSYLAVQFSSVFVTIMRAPMWSGFVCEMGGWNNSGRISIRSSLRRIVEEQKYLKFMNAIGCIT